MDKGWIVYTANHGENYGWKILGGGTNYSGTKIDPNGNRFTKGLKLAPSIAEVHTYKGDEFKEWNGDALITSLKDQSLRK